MDFFVYVLVVMMFVGACLVIYGAFFGNKLEASSQNEDELISLARGPEPIPSQSAIKNLLGAGLMKVKVSPPLGLPENPAAGLRSR